MVYANDPLSPTRLSLARRLRGLKQTEVAVATHISRQSLWAYEHGRQVPNPAIVEQLGDALAVPPAFLTAGDVDEPTADSISFRSLRRLPGRQRDQATAMSTIAIQVSTWIDRLFEVPAVDIPDWQFVEPEIAADSLRGQWGLGYLPVPHLIHHLESRGIRVFSVETIADRWSGMDALSFWYDQTPYVLLNTAKSRSRLRMSLAHELGHLVLHQGDGFANRRDAEREAAQFASAFLMPQSSMLACGVRTADMKTLKGLKHEWGVSIAALVYRLHAVGMLSERRYRSAFIDLTSLGWRLDEPLDTEQDITPESSQLLHKVLTELRAEGVLRRDIAHQLHLYPADLDALLMGLVPTIRPDPFPRS